ncbi:hypothetical protein [Listeria ilorinensis]|uniref:hypothetical protein n=1 Tax=Listeria ilorinensis TaxID=2867439 RepID=UPI001EF3F1C6|nr:hypothetical protein [Listeria ilorinensis]
MQIIYVSVDNNQYLTGYATSEFEESIQVEADEEFFTRGFTNYKISKKKLVYDDERARKQAQEKVLRDATPSTSEQLLSVQLVATDLFEQNLQLQQQLIDTQIAMTELFESTL